ncbi:MAG TPA: YfhO family protein [Anaerolineae bacterium]|nr:YfhO family protein [Anaerolineae bacterium]HOR01090.1 YfhO family protein [Anaerolineae bacterium]HPL30471.1 YfhO family protein [Anaerolineae bacterium]
MQVGIDRVRGPLARHGSLPYLAGLGAVLAALYWPAASLQGIFYEGDILRLNYPARAIYAAALRSGRIPLWTPNALNGYPILAEGQTGAYSPLNLLLYRWLPLPAALNYSALLSFWIAGAGLFMYARALGLRRGAAFLAGCTFMLGGFLPAHLGHMNMVAAVAWLPWLLWGIERATQAPSRRAWALPAAFFGLMGLAGHPQVLLLSAIPAAAQALLGPLGSRQPRPGLRRHLGQLALCSGALTVGGVLAAAQLLPTYQLTALSQRGQALSYEFFTSFSLPPGDLVRLLRPFAGNPYPAVSCEAVCYVGLLPLVLAASALPLCRSRAAAFWVAIAGLGLLLALGFFNPAYRLLWQVPLVNKFRVPARYLLWVDLGAAVLAAQAADALATLARPAVARGRLLAPGAGLSLAGLAAVGSVTLPLEALLAGWRWLPLAWLAAAAALIAALALRPPARLWLALAIGLTLADLGAFVGVTNRTYNAPIAPAELARAPDALRFLQADAGPELYRIYTDERTVPSAATMRASLYPNTSLVYGVQSAGGYYPLVPNPQEWLRASYTARLLDLVNVRYVVVPQPQGAAPQGLQIADSPFAAPLAGRGFDLQPQPVAALQAEGFTQQLAGVAYGAPLAEVVLEGAGGEQTVWTLRAGMDLAAWDDAAPGPHVTRTWPAQFPGGLGRTYLASHTLAEPLQAVRVEVRPLVPQGCLRLERLRLRGPAGDLMLPAAMGEGDHVLAYCSPSVTIYRNEGAGPRAFLAPSAQAVQSDAEAYGTLAAPGFRPQQDVLVLGGVTLSGSLSPDDQVAIESYGPEYVRLRAVTASRAYLVLADSDYGGWRAWVDGRPAAIRRADVALRAVLLEPGEHTVEFRFEPRSWFAAVAVSMAGWAALAVVVLWRR